MTKADWQWSECVSDLVTKKGMCECCESQLNERRGLRHTVWEQVSGIIDWDFF